MANSNGGGNARKIGRNKADAQRYEREGRLAKNKAKALKRHLKRMGLPDTYLGGYTVAGGPPHGKKPQTFA